MLSRKRIFGLKNRNHKIQTFILFNKLKKKLRLKLSVTRVKIIFIQNLRRTRQVEVNHHKKITFPSSHCTFIGAISLEFFHQYSIVRKCYIVEDTNYGFKQNLKAKI